MTGWIKLHRQLQTHWLYSEKRSFSQLEAWIDILMTVNHKDNKISIKGKPYEVKRGESLNSLDTWARRWNWHKSKVRRFLVLLQSDNMIVFKSETKSTRITVCNYDSYQETRNDTESDSKRSRNGSETLPTPNKNDKNEETDNNEKKIEDAFDFDKKESKEYTDLLNDLCVYFKVSEQRNQRQYMMIGNFVRHLESKGDLVYLKKQFEGYKKEKNGNYIHGIDKYLGSPEDSYQDGQWNVKEWSSSDNSKVLPMSKRANRNPQ